MNKSLEKQSFWMTWNVYEIYQFLDPYFFPSQHPHPSTHVYVPLNPFKFEFTTFERGRRQPLRTIIGGSCWTMKVPEREIILLYTRSWCHCTTSCQPWKRKCLVPYSPQLNSGGRTASSLQCVLKAWECCVFTLQLFLKKTSSKKIQGFIYYEVHSDWWDNIGFCYLLLTYT